MAVGITRLLMVAGMMAAALRFPEAESVLLLGVKLPLLYKIPESGRSPFFLSLRLVANELCKGDILVHDSKYKI